MGQYLGESIHGDQTGHGDPWRMDALEVVFLLPTSG